MTAPTGAVRRWSRRAAAILPPALVTLLVVLYAVDVPYWDTWDWLDRHYPSAPPAASMLERYWEPFNGHRVFVSLLLDRALFWASGIDVWPRIVLKLPLSLLTLWLVLRLARSSLPRAPGVLTTGIVAALAFPLAYWPMWMDPRQFSMHLVVLALVTACTAAVGSGSTAHRSAVTALLCIVASLSYGPGVLTWPCVLILLALRDPRPSRAVLVAWTILGTVFVGLQMVAANGGTMFEPTAPASWWATVHAAAAIAGLPVAPSSVVLGYRPTRVMGLIGVALFVTLGTLVVRSRRDTRLRMLPWLAIGAWGLSYACMAAVTRGGLSLPSLHDPRFAYGSSLLWIAIVVLLCDAHDIDTSARQAPAGPDVSGATYRSQWPAMLGPVGTWTIAAGVIAAGLGPFLAPGGISRLHDQLVLGRACLSAERLSDDACLERLYPSAARVRTIAVHLTHRGAAFFPSPQPGEPQPREREPVSHR